MTVREAMAVLELQLFRDATGYFPGAPLWETIYNDFQENKWTLEQIKKPWVEWCKRGYNTKSLAWMEWIGSPIPERQKYATTSKPGPVDMHDVEQERKQKAWDAIQELEAKHANQTV